jgi:hypothetical protein
VAATKIILFMPRSQVARPPTKASRLHV